MELRTLAAVSAITLAITAGLAACGSDGPAASRLAPGRSLTGALRRVPLLPVCSPAKAGGGGVMLAVFRRPTQTVTPAPAETLQRTPYRCPC